MLLDSAGIDCSTGAACSAGVAQPSHVLLAMGCSEAEARSALRFSLGHSSTAGRRTAPSRRHYRKLFSEPRRQLHSRKDRLVAPVQPVRDCAGLPRQAARACRRRAGRTE